MSFRRTRGHDIVRVGGVAGLQPSTGGLQHSATRSLPPFLPGLKPSYEVALGFEAHRDIRREIRSINVASDFAELETGGWLLSDKRQPDKIVVATQPGENSRHTRTTVELDLSRAEQVQHAYPHLSLRGDWHLHPSGDHIPSETDRRAWARGRELVGDYWIAIVVTPARTMWDTPKLHGWITTETCCERLAVREL